MAEEKNASTDSTKKEQKTLANIEPIKTEENHTNIKSPKSEGVSIDNRAAVEQSLIDQQYFFRICIRKSGAAVKDAIDSARICRSQRSCECVI